MSTSVGSTKDEPRSGRLKTATNEEMVKKEIAETICISKNRVSHILYEI